MTRLIVDAGAAFDAQLARVEEQSVRERERWQQEAQERSNAEGQASKLRVRLGNL